MPVIIPSNKTSIFPGNFLIYLNDLAKLIPWSTMNTTPSGAFDIAQYLSSFDYVVIEPRISADPLLSQDINIMEQALLFNPRMKFYAYIDGKTIVDSPAPNDPNSQVVTIFNDINNNYNSSKMVMGGIYFDNFELLNVGKGSLSGQNFRETQLSIQREANRRNMFVAVSTPARYTPTASMPYKGGYSFITNLPWVLNIISNVLPSTTLYDASIDTPTMATTASGQFYQVSVAGSVILNGVLTNLTPGNMIYKNLAGIFSVAYSNMVAPTTISYNAATNTPPMATTANDTIMYVQTAGNQIINGTAYYLNAGDAVIRDSLGVLYYLSGGGSGVSTNMSNYYLHLNNTNTIIDYNLFGYSFSNNSNWSGYTSTNDFLSNILLINRIRLDVRNLGVKFSMAITTNSSTDYESNNFFTPGSNNIQGGPVLAQKFYNLATFLNADSVATSAYADFYASENPSSSLMVSSIFDWDKNSGPLGTSYYYPLSEMISLGQGTVAYSANTNVAVKVVQNPSNNTSGMILLGNNHAQGAPIIII